LSNLVLLILFIVFPSNTFSIFNALVGIWKIQTPEPWT